MISLIMEQWVMKYGIPFAVGLTTLVGLTPLPAKSADLSGETTALSYMRSQGVSLVDIGTDCGGLGGALGQKDGKLQTFYVSPDGTHIVAGVCFRAGGVNVTGLQLERLTKTTNDPDILGVQPEAGLQSGAQEAAPQMVPSQTEASPLGTGPSPEIEDPSALLQAAETTAWFPVGAKKAPVIYFIADPRCPYCHAMWDAMAPAVYDGKIQVRLILVGVLGADSVNDATAILALQNPAMAWLGGVGSGKKPASISDQKALEAGEAFLTRNELFRKSNRIGGVPFLIYKTADGVKTHYGADAPEQTFERIMHDL
jgi:hypothetical protein